LHYSECIKQLYIDWIVDPDLRNRRIEQLLRCLFQRFRLLLLGGAFGGLALLFQRFGQAGMRFALVRVIAQGFVKRGDGVIHLAVL
jgi:hypothetical protein